MVKNMLDICITKLEAVARRHLRLNDGNCRRRGASDEQRIETADDIQGWRPLPTTLTRFDGTGRAWLSWTTHRSSPGGRYDQFRGRAPRNMIEVRIENTGGYRRLPGGAALRVRAVL